MKNLKITKTGKGKRIRRPIGTTSVIAIGFLTIILVGACLLMLPISTVGTEAAPPLTAAFTAVSATCVTGLVVEESGTYWSVFGQCVILLMMQVGGLGFMTIAALLSMIVKRSMSPRERILMATSYGTSNYGEVAVMVRRILIGTLVIEGSGSLLLAFRFIPQYGPIKGLFYSIFHSVSAFCNAGFDILGNGDSFGVYAEDPLVSLTIVFLIVLGGIGFPVWNEFTEMIKRRKRGLSVYSRFVVIITSILIFGGAAIWCLLEWNNPETLGPLSVGNKLLCSLFQSVTLRTAGFSTLNFGAAGDGTKLASIMFMFTGGASGSTAGGVKVATIGIILVSAFAVASGRKTLNLMKRRISNETILRATSLVVVQLLLTLLATIICYNSYSEVPILDVLFEVVSAGGTVGLTTGITASLPPVALIVLMFMMYFGRVGVLTITYSLMHKSNSDDSFITYPDANIMIG